MAYIVDRVVVCDAFRESYQHYQRLVALKLLPDAFAHDPELKACFHREARALASLHHSNIASIFGFEEGKPPDRYGFLRNASTASRTVS